MSALLRGTKQWVRRHSGLVGSATSVNTSAAQVVLTYDDGPEPGETEKVLNALDEHGFHATFFVLMTRVRKHASLLLDIQSLGHEIALHGEDHRELIGRRRSEIIRVTSDARAELQDLTGREIVWLRPPYGRQTVRSWLAVRSMGMEPIMWSGTLWDSRADKTDQQRVEKATNQLRPGGILLGHDGYAGAEDNAFDGPAPRIDRRQLNGQIFRAINELGLRGVSLQEALVDGTLEKTMWFGK